MATARQSRVIPRLGDFLSGCPAHTCYFEEGTLGGTPPAAGAKALPGTLHAIEPVKTASQRFRRQKNSSKRKGEGKCPTI
jgi:hypothetical protein